MSNYYDIYKNFMTSVEVLEEARTDDARRIVGNQISPEDFQYMVDNEPTRASQPAYKYILWMAKAVKSGADPKEVVRYVNTYHKILNSIPVASRNIEQFKSFEDFKDYLEPYVGGAEDLDVKDDEIINFDSQKDDFYVAYEDSESIMLRVLTTAASCNLAKPVKASWCLAGSGAGWTASAISYFSTYLNEKRFARMYFIFKKVDSFNLMDKVEYVIDGRKIFVSTNKNETFAVLTKVEKNTYSYDCWDGYDKNIKIDSVKTVYPFVQKEVQEDYQTKDILTYTVYSKVIERFNQYISTNNLKAFDDYLGYFIGSMNKDEFTKFMDEIFAKFFSSIPQEWYQASRNLYLIRKNFPFLFINSDDTSLENIFPKLITDSIRRGYVDEKTLRYHLNFIQIFYNLKGSKKIRGDAEKELKSKFKILFDDYIKAFKNPEKYRNLIINLNKITASSEEMKYLLMFYLLYPLCSVTTNAYRISMLFERKKKEMRNILVEELSKVSNKNIRGILFEEINNNDLNDGLELNGNFGEYYHFGNLLEDFNNISYKSKYPNLIRKAESLFLNSSSFGDMLPEDSEYVADIIREVIKNSYYLNRSNIGMEDFKILFGIGEGEILRSLSMSMKAPHDPLDPYLQNPIDYDLLVKNALQKMNQRNFMFTSAFKENLDKLIKYSNTNIDAFNYVIQKMFDSYFSTSRVGELFDPCMRFMNISNSFTKLNLSKFLTSAIDRDIDTINNDYLKALYSQTPRIKGLSLMEMFNDIQVFDMEDTKNIVKNLVSLNVNQKNHYKNVFNESYYDVENFSENSIAKPDLPIYLDSSASSMVLTTIDAILLNSYFYMAYVKSKVSSSLANAKDALKFANFKLDVNNLNNDQTFQFINQTIGYSEFGLDFENIITVLRKNVYDIIFIDYFLKSLEEENGPLKYIGNSKDLEIQKIRERQQTRKNETLQLLAETEAELRSFKVPFNSIQNNLENLIQHYNSVGQSFMSTRISPAYFNFKTIVDNSYTFQTDSNADAISMTGSKTSSENVTLLKFMQLQDRFKTLPFGDKTKPLYSLKRTNRVSTINTVKPNYDFADGLKFMKEYLQKQVSPQISERKVRVTKNYILQNNKDRFSQYENELNESLNKLKKSVFKK